MYKRALVSVYDKSGLEDFLSPLVKKGLQIVSTGGTAQFLKSKGFKVIDVKDLTCFPEVLSGRVKSLHPHVHISLLARSWVPEDQKTLQDFNLTAFDLVVGHLYPFKEKTKDLKDKELVEWIDVGGPSFLRAAAKNYFSITTVCDPRDYPQVKKGTDLTLRKQLAVKVFKNLSFYNFVIAEKLNQSLKDGLKDPDLSTKAEDSSTDSSGLSTKVEDSSTNSLEIQARFFKKLRYGENPHQRAKWFVESKNGLHQARLLQGKALSYNNLLDFHSAVLGVRDFKEPCALSIKHNNPCGMALGDNISQALEKAIQADKVSVFGGIIALNRPLDKASALHLNSLFLEGIIAPDFSSSALSVLKPKKNLRILKWPDMLTVPLAPYSVREVFGGFLLQSQSSTILQDFKTFKIIGQNPPPEIKKDLLFAFKLCAHLKSNAISIVKQGQSLGLGMGQVSRVAAVRLALARVKEFHPHQQKNLILASDAFFPFPDSIELASVGGVLWIIQPGGSVQDEKVIKKVKQLGLNMVLTGQRCFKH